MGVGDTLSDRGCVNYDSNGLDGSRFLTWVCISTRPTRPTRPPFPTLEVMESFRFLASLHLAGTAQRDGGEKTQLFHHFKPLLISSLRNIIWSKVPVVKNIPPLTIELDRQWLPKA